MTPLRIRWSSSSAAGRRAPVEPPGAGVVHVWAVALDVSPACLARLGAALSDDERARAARFHTAELSARFTVARGVLRELLGAYLGEAPAAVRFAYDAAGKPSIAPSLRASPHTGSTPVTPPLHFNLSHAAGLALVAVSTGGRIGVDVERIVERDDIAGVAERVLAPAERSALARMPVARRTAAFYRCWTRKEAYLKARGVGLLVPLDAVDVSIDRRRAALRGDGTDARAAASWRIAHLEPAAAFVGAVAVEGRRVSVRCARWDG